jgi:hypothetical protein
LADFCKSSPLKPLSQMNRSLVGSIYGMSSMKIAHFVKSKRMTDDGHQVMAKAYIAFGKVSKKEY